MTLVAPEARLESFCVVDWNGTDLVSVSVLIWILLDFTAELLCLVGEGGVVFGSGLIAEPIAPIAINEPTTKRSLRPSDKALNQPNIRTSSKPNFRLISRKAQAI